MKCLIVLTLELYDPNDVVDALYAIKPDNVPRFAGMTRIVLDPHATAIEKWLDEKDAE
jgi:hypothetical protein